MPLNQIFLIIIGGGMVVGMLYLFVRVLLRPTSNHTETKFQSGGSTKTGVAGKAKV